MRKWMKGFAAAGIIMLFTGTGLTAWAGAMGGTALFAREHADRLAGRIVDSLERGGLGRLMHWGYGSWDTGRFWDDDDWDDDDWDDDDWDYTCNSGSYGPHTGYDAGGSAKAGMMDNKGFSESDKLPGKDEMELKAEYKGVKKLELKVESGVLQVVENQELTDQIRIYLKKTSHSAVRHESENASTELEVKYYVTESGVNKRVDGLIEIPAGYRFDQLEAEADAGVVYLPSVKAGKLSLDSDAADISVSGFEAQSVEVDADAGSVRGAGSVEKTLSISADVSAVSLTLSGKKEDFNYQIDNDMGSVRIGSEEGSMGRQKMNNNAGKKIAVEASMSAVQINFR